MSAFVCSDYHISYIVCAGVKFKAWVNLGGGLNYLTGDKAQRVFEVLKRENIKSVNFRYKDSRKDVRDDMLSVGFTETLGKVDRTIGGIEPFQALKAIHCLEYQSCETETWEKSLAHSICRAIESAIIWELPGYESAKWGLEEPSYK